MATVFIQIDKPFYLAGDTVNGCVFLNLFDNMAASEVLIKFKGWESVRWFESRVISETERESIAPHLIFQNVPLPHPDLQTQNGQLRLRRQTRRRIRLQVLFLLSRYTSPQKGIST